MQELLREVETVNEGKTSPKKEKKIYLQLENSDNTNTIDIINVAENMGKRKKIYRYAFIIVLCLSIIAGILYSYVDVNYLQSSYAEAVLNLQYNGIEKGLDPNGSAIDLNMIKSPQVIANALISLEMDTSLLEDIRKNIEIEGVIPEDAVNRITVINQMAQKDATNYEKLLDVSYYPSQYKVRLNINKAVSDENIAQVLDAILIAYKQYFNDTYANTEVLSSTVKLIDYQDYDYIQIIDMVENQINIMVDYVSEREKQNSNFRAVSTGLSFGDIKSSLKTIQSVDLNNLEAFVRSVPLTKDKMSQIEYLNYTIDKYLLDLVVLQSNLETVQEAIDTYQKDPMIVMSNEETIKEFEHSNDYYDNLVQQKIDINSQIAKLNSKITYSTNLLEDISKSNAKINQTEYDYADGKLDQLSATLDKWIELTEETTDEFYSTTLFSNAVAITVPAQFNDAGGLVSIAKKVLICVAAGLLVVLFIWGIDGLKTEIKYVRMKAHEEKK